MNRWEKQETHQGNGSKTHFGIRITRWENKKPIKGMELTKAKSILGLELPDGKIKKPIKGMELTKAKSILGIE